VLSIHTWARNFTAFAILDVPASEAVYIGNNYKTDLSGAKAAGLALAGLIRQSEDEKRAFGEDLRPDFVTEDLRGAFNEISQNNKARQSLKEQNQK